jgi:ribosome-associated protein
MNEKMDDQIEALRQWILQELDDAKALDVLELDIRALTQIADWMVVASGTSTRHVLALAEKLREAGVKHGQKPVGVEGDNDGEWVLMDFGDVLVHLMLPATREFYDLEGLWNERLGMKVSQVREQVEG